MGMMTMHLDGSNSSSAGASDACLGQCPASASGSGSKSAIERPARRLVAPGLALLMAGSGQVAVTSAQQTESSWGSEVIVADTGSAVDEWLASVLADTVRDLASRQIELDAETVEILYRHLPDLYA